MSMAHHEMEGVGVDYDGGALLAVEEKPGLWASGGSEGMFGSTPFTRAEAGAIAQRLNVPLARCETRTRPGPGGVQLTYIEGWKVVQEANLLFGYNGWSSKVLKETIHYIDAQGAGRFSVAATALVRVTLRDGTAREDTGGGTCDGMRNKGDAIVKAVKEAITDATKRALKGFGPRLGLCLYDKEHIREMKKGPPPMRTSSGPPQGNRRSTTNQNHHPNAHRTPPAQQGTRQVTAAHRQAAALQQPAPNAPTHHGGQAPNAQHAQNTSAYAAPPASNRHVPPNAPHQGVSNNVKVETASGNGMNGRPHGGAHNANAPTVSGNDAHRPSGFNARQTHGHGNGSSTGGGQASVRGAQNARRNSADWRHAQEAQHADGQQQQQQQHAVHNSGTGSEQQQQANAGYGHGNHNRQAARSNSGMGAPPSRPTSGGGGGGGPREASAQMDRRQHAHMAAVGATTNGQVVHGGAGRRNSAQSTSNYGRPHNAAVATPSSHGRPPSNARHPHAHAHPQAQAGYHASPVTPGAMDAQRSAKRMRQEVAGPTQQRARDALVKNELDELKHIDPGNFY